MFKQLKRTHQEASNSSVETEQAAKRVNATSETPVTKKVERKMKLRYLLIQKSISIY